MDYLGKLDVAVAHYDGNGQPAFIDVPPPAVHEVSGAVEAAYVWGTDNAVALPNGIGGPVSSVAFPSPGGSRFGLVCFPPRSAGKLDIGSQGGAEGAQPGEYPGMHRSDTLDYEVIISGKVDIVLEGGARRTMGPGSCLVMGGVMHAWENVYDEPCIYAVVVIGALGGAHNGD